jgi:hypothetical protein
MFDRIGNPAAESIAHDAPDFFARTGGAVANIEQTPLTGRQDGVARNASLLRKYVRSAAMARANIRRR